MENNELLNQIENLTSAINELHKFLKGEDIKNEVVEFENPAIDVVEDFIQNTFTEIEVKNTCMRIARSIPDGRNKVKAVLSEYGAVKAAELKEEFRKEFIDKITVLK
tara:strand:+ start:1749 stop:2069 length:321 start_codon:yes stop_codon:yes gene_type:complete